VEIIDLEERVEDIRKEKAAVVKKQDYEEAARLRDKERNLQADLEQARHDWEERSKNVVYDVNEEDIATVVSMMTGVPVNRVAQTESEKILKMEEELKRHIVGQDEAIGKLAKAIRRTRAGLKNSRRPIGSFIFLGPTGVGKTELCKALAKYLFDTEDALVKVDMSEYIEKFAVSRLVGAPPGYVGYEEGGQLTEKVRRKPYSVVLLDEIEKAHPDIFSILLQVLDEGVLTDSFGRRVDFRNTVIIMTSNLGARDIRSTGGFGFSSDDERSKHDQMKNTIDDAVKKLFSPEFLNRVDDQIVFRALTKEDILEIVDIEARELLKNVHERKMALELDESARKFLADKGFDPKYGARPLARAIQKYIEDPLSEEILRGAFKEGSKIVAKHFEESEELVFVEEPGAAETTEETDGEGNHISNS
ncbi:MAG: AAA domain-containing protein, partial [Ignavibacteriales bacterium]|nr:AAA domain-containing protein [Ignavibacteriales bacterium]